MCRMTGKLFTLTKSHRSNKHKQAQGKRGTQLVRRPIWGPRPRTPVWGMNDSGLPAVLFLFVVYVFALFSLVCLFAGYE